MNLRDKNVKVATVLTVLLLGGLAVYLGLLLIQKSKTPPPITEKTPDLYQAREITIKEPAFIRGRFDRVEGDRVYLEISKYGSPTEIEEVQLSQETAYGCTGRYKPGPDGEKIDRFDLFLDTSRIITSEEDAPQPLGKNLEWFLDNVKRGEAVEAYFVFGQDGSRKTHSIYFIKDSCPND